MPRHEKVRNRMGFTNVEIMVPFIAHRGGETEQVVSLLAENGKTRRQRPAFNHDVRAACQRHFG